MGDQTASLPPESKGQTLPACRELPDSSCLCSPHPLQNYKVNFHALMGIGNSLGALEEVTPLPGRLRAGITFPLPTWTALSVLAGAGQNLVDFPQLINTPLPSSVPLANKLSEATFPHFKAL